MTETPPEERLVHTYRDHEAVQRAVNLLADRSFPVRALRVEGRDVRVVELITERVSTWRAVSSGALRGVWFGAAIGLIIGLATSSVVLPVVCGLVVGALFGAVFIGLAQTSMGTRRGLVATQALQAAAYDLWVPADMHGRAVEILGQAGDLPIPTPRTRPAETDTAADADREHAAAT